MTNITCTVSITIKAPQSKVWDALTKPEIVKQYFFGTTLITDWKVGSKILWKGEWEGKAYEDKGTVLQYESGKMLKYNYWSSFSGQPDVPENYQAITYELTEQSGLTTLIITQDNCRSEEVRAHSESNWKSVMDGMKKLVEKD
jgi:uncharacterized protein YndB with AHSA1/START domain